MSAAELLARAERRAAAFRLSTTTLKWLAIVAVLASGYWRGRVDGRSGAQAAALVAQAHTIQAHLDTNATATTVALAHRDSTQRAAAVQVGRADSERVRTRQAEAPIALINDSTVAITTIDSAGPVLERDTIPPLVIAELRADRAQITQDSITIRAQAADLQSLTALVALTNQRVDLQDQQLKTLAEQLAAEKPPRLGFKSGVLAGVLAIVGLLHVVK